MIKPILLVLSLWLAGCAALVEEPDPELLNEILGDAAIPNAEPRDVLFLSQEVRTFIDSHINPRWRSAKKLDQLRDILFSPELFAIEYESGTTKTATETFDSRAGNFLSMTNLFIGKQKQPRNLSFG